MLQSRLALLWLTSVSCLCSDLLVVRAIADDFPEVRNSASEDKKSPLPAQEAVEKMQLPEGFRATVFASEPDVQNPIGMAWDNRGRLWVAENYTYSDRQQRFDLSHRDRVLIFEDTDGDGRADSRKVFCDNVQMLTSVEVGRGGVWLICCPQLLFIPDADEDGIADGPARVVLDGFEVAQDNYHNFANGLRWGPEGWLYGRCGHSCPGLLGLPGTPAERRVPIDGGIWRYHPERKVVEVLSHGTVNPWGHDWDANGELFFINTVIGHLWHLVPGSHFKESFGESDNPRVYERMDMIADHYHFDRNGSWQNSRDGKANDLGGGHAHIGMMIYNGDSWPKQYHGKLFTINMHGRRANVERLERRASGYVGRHEPDFLIAEDPFFRGLDLSIGPDGNCYVIDWSDTGECHESDGVHRRSGRIFRIAHEQTSSQKPFAKPSCTSADTKLSRLWASYREGSVTREQLRVLLNETDEHIRVWAIRLLTDSWPLDLLTGPSPFAQYVDDAETRKLLVERARSDDSGLVRRQLASTLQRLPVEHRLDLAMALASHTEDQDDVDLNLLVWFGVSPAGERDPKQIISLALSTEWGHLTSSISRFVASQVKKHPSALDSLLSQAASLDDSKRTQVLQGVSAAMSGWLKAPQPKSWPSFAAKISAEHRTTVQQLSLVFGDGLAPQKIREFVLDGKQPLRERETALQSLIDFSPDESRKICESLLDTRVINATAARGLARFDDPAIAKLLIQKFKKFQPSDRPTVIELLASRTTFAQVLLDELAEEKSNIQQSDLKASNAYQINNLGDAALSEKLGQVWGNINKSPAERIALIREWTGRLTSDNISKANLVEGRKLYDKNCSQCHKLFGEGKQVGPELTGAQRNSLEYLLGNILDPSAVVGKEYRLSTILTSDGRAISGLIMKKDDQRILLRTATDEVSIPTDDVETVKESTVSAMPDGLLQNLTEEQVRDLLGYLMSPVQVAKE
jgi:putative membrane-bound dehydrogenase-like protein